MVKDIVPDLLGNIEKDFKWLNDNDKTIKKVQKLVREGKATYKDVNAYARAIGKNRTLSYAKNITKEILPDERMYYNIANRIVTSTLTENHNLIAEVAAEVQENLNKSAGIGIAAKKPKLNEQRIRGIVNKVANAENFEDVVWMLNEPIKTYAQEIVDEAAKTNAQAHYNAGLTPIIERIEVGNCCDWCKQLAGKYTYPDCPDEVYKRHKHCRCMVLYNPGGSKRRQNVHRQNEWIDEEEYKKIKEKRPIQHEQDLYKQKDKSIRKGIKNLEKNILLHEDKILHPEEYFNGWEELSEARQRGVIKHWEKEINTSKESIKRRKEELKRREKHGK